MTHPLRALCLLTCCALVASACGEKPPPTHSASPSSADATTTHAASAQDPSTAPPPTPSPPTTPLTPSTSAKPPTTPRVGGGCAYKDTLGSITITSITDPEPNANVCPKPSQAVRFSFTPNGADAPTVTDRAITIGDGKALPTACLEPLGLKVDAVIIDVVHKELTSGACAPVAFSFPEGFLLPCTDACF
jgi:hypothetical protein